MNDIFVTLDTSQDDILLLNADAELNMDAMDVTLDVSQVEISPLKLDAP